MAKDRGNEDGSAEALDGAVITGPTARWEGDVFIFDELSFLFFLVNIIIAVILIMTDN